MENKYKMAFCGLSLKLYPTGKTAPSFEYSASASKSKFQCSLTKKLYGLSQVMDWYNTPEVQATRRSSDLLKWASKTQEPKEIKYGNTTEQIFTLYMAKPYKPTAVDGFKKVQVPPIQPQPQTIQKQQVQVKEELDDDLPPF
jgi:hypothetical protein